jgi:long-chain acyl-CoA synthetase
MLTHRNLVANAFHAVSDLHISKDWTWLHSAPMFHLANGGAMYAMVMCAAKHCFIPGFEPEAFLKAVQRYRVTSVLLVPTMMNMAMNHPAMGRYDLSSLRYVTYGASPMPLDLLRRAMDRLPGAKFRQGYGLSETSPLLTVLQPEDHTFDNLDQRFTPVKSAGRPVVGVEVRVVDLDDNDLPPGQIGEIIARGANIMKGYWNRPEITAEVMRGGWFHTGDMGAFDERGFLYILDRKKDMIKTGGENVYSPEVEDVIYTHAAVLEAAVVGVPDEKWGESIKAVVVVRDGQRLTEGDLIEHCRARLTHFKCPSSVDFAEALPKGGTGKIQKNVLREKYWKGEGKGVH